MKHCYTSYLFLTCLAGTQLAAQSPAKELPLISVGDGLTLFSGDVGHTNTTGGSFRYAYRFGVEERLSDWIGAEVFANYGKLSKSERSATLNRNFESPLLFVGANAMLYFDNNTLLKRDAPFAPYLAAGFGWMSFDPHGDLQDKNNRAYHYWSNGSIHNLAENDPAASSSILLQRDYTYETQLKDSTNNYTRSTFGIPLSIGFRWKFGAHAGVNIQASYFLTFSDYIDNVKSGGNDSWWWYGASVYYKFGKESSSTFSGSDRQAMLKEDADGDGIPDLSDNCAGTPTGVKVDTKGCPLDADGDGVADYLDKEPNTKRGAQVDVNGVSIDYTAIQKEAEADSVNAAQKSQFEANPSQETLQKANPAVKKSGPDCIPQEFRAADVNKDCVITADEINTAIDNFFDGVGNWTADGVNRLIDYFFDQ